MCKKFPPSRIHRHAVATILFKYSSKDSSSSPIKIWPQIKGRTVCRRANFAGGLFYLVCGQLAFSLLWTVFLSALDDLPQVVGCHLGWHYAVCYPLRGDSGNLKVKKGLLTTNFKKRFVD
jgi:hypothetical protein